MSDEHVTCPTPLPDPVDVYTECECCADLRAQLADERKSHATWVNEHNNLRRIAEDDLRAQLAAARAEVADIEHVLAQGQITTVGAGLKDNADAVDQTIHALRYREAECEKLRAELSGKAGELAEVHQAAKRYQERLSEAEKLLNGQYRYISPVTFDKVCQDVEAAEAEVVALRKALAPFAAKAEWYERDNLLPCRTSDRWNVLVPLGDCRRAQDILAQPSPAAERIAAMQAVCEAVRKWDRVLNLDSAELALHEALAALDNKEATDA